MSKLFQPLRLPNGQMIPNRIAKAAMEENLADADHAPGKALIRLYRSWAEGGAGLIITGNVMVDRHALTGPAGVVLDSECHLERFAAWAEACRSRGAQGWIQINHPGRQLMADLGQPAFGPSAVAVNIPGLEKLFAQPRALSEVEIERLIQRYTATAVLAERAGFTGVQIHAAHGYLFSQFLSPLSNRRTDQWGGSLENRARILLRTVAAVRAQVAPQFCVAVKLNSADFQRGGFDAEDAAAVVQLLNKEAVDLVELSGGSYESPAMQGRTRDGSSLAREASPRVRRAHRRGGTHAADGHRRHPSSRGGRAGAGRAGGDVGDGYRAGGRPGAAAPLAVRRRCGCRADHGALEEQGVRLGGDPVDHQETAGVAQPWQAGPAPHLAAAGATEQPAEDQAAVA